MQKKYKILSLIIFFLLAFTPPLNPPTGGWTQQFMPDLGGRTIQDITFLDSLIGYASARQSFDTSYILKTTNGGDNWEIIYRNFFAMTQIQFLNTNTGYAVGAYLFKTTNGGFNWSQVSAPAISPEELYVINENLIWLVSSEPLTGGVYFTSNGGINWDRQFSGGNQNPNKIYMYNERIGFISNSSASPNIYKTTNGGANWSVNLSNENFTDMHFADSLNGWKCTNSSTQAGTIKKTTDGGLNWVIQYLPPESPPFSFSRMYKFSFVNMDTIWGIGGVYTFINGQSRGVIYKTTNGGLNWGYQIPDTTINIYIYNTIQFVNKKIGWAYSPSMGGIHTTTGGDTITGIQPINHEIPDVFVLYQNFPNPFNPVTNIRYGLRAIAFINLKVYDITGKQICLLENENQRAGVYEYTFDGSNFSSGIYFYAIQINTGKEVYIDTKKMILIK